MKTTILYSSGDAARELGISRDALHWAIRIGAPCPNARVAGRRVFNSDDLHAIRGWLATRPKPLLHRKTVPHAVGIRRICSEGAK